MDIIIGVPRDPTKALSRANSAHAWLATETTPALVDTYVELQRISAGMPAERR